MRAVRCSGAGLKIRDVDRPTGEGMRVRVTHVGICGSDLIFVADGCSDEVTLGHEIAGRLDDGRPVAIEPLLPCGVCTACARGLYNVCETERWLGGTVDGGMAEEIRVPERCLVPVPDGVALGDACLAEPLAVGLHGLRRAGVTSQDSVAIVGGGAIGLLTAAVGVSLGCDVTVVARHSHQREAAVRLGARVAGAPVGHDVAVAAAGGPDGVALAIECARPGGTVLVLNEPHAPFLGPAAVYKELTAVTSLAYAANGARDIDDAMLLLAERPEIASLITHRFPLAEAQQAFAVAADRRGGAIKVVLETGLA